jgi:hypothetical protein
MTIKVYPIDLSNPTLWVNFNRFMFELHTSTQRLAVDAAKAEADKLASTDLTGLATNPSTVTSNGYPIYYLAVIRQAYQQKDALNNRVDLLSTDLGAALDAFTACGVYGTDSAIIASEIARIKSNAEPS